MQVEKIELLIAQSRYKMAYDEVKSLLASEPYNDHAIRMLAVCCLNLKKYDEAEEVIKDGISRQPYNSYYFYLLANMEAVRNNLVASEKYINEALGLDSYIPDYFDLKARIHLVQNQYVKAEEAARLALEIDAQHTDALNALAKALIGQGKGKEAATVMDKALQYSPENWETHSNYGFRCLEKGQVKEAIEHFRSALLNDPNQLHAQNGMKLAMKAKFPLYRWLLQFQLFLSKKGRQFNIFVVFGIIILMNILRGIEEGTEGWLSVGISVLLFGLMGFVLSTWILDPIMTFVLSTRRDGRLSLNDGERNTATFVMWNLIIMLAGAVTYFIFKDLAWLNLVGVGFMGLVCTAGMWESGSIKKRRIAMLFYGLSAIFFIGGLTSKVVFSEAIPLLSTLGVFTGVAYSWVGNSLFSKN